MTFFNNFLDSPVSAWHLAWLTHLTSLVLESFAPFSGHCIPFSPSWAHSQWKHWESLCISGTSQGSAGLGRYYSVVLLNEGLQQRSVLFLFSITQPNHHRWNSFCSLLQHLGLSPPHLILFMIIKTKYGFWRKFEKCRKVFKGKKC